MTPTTEPAKRISTLFRRKPSTPWSDKEVRAYRHLYKLGCFKTLDDLRLVETYYVFNLKKPDHYLRRDLYTFLNNYLGEVDRARLWAETNQAKVRKANPPRPELGSATDEDFKRAGTTAKKMVEELRLQLGSGALK